MPRKPRITEKTTAEQQGTFDHQVNLSGAGEDPAVKALLDQKFVAGTDLQSLDIALVLQEIIRGQQSILGQVNAGNTKVTDELERLRARMDAYDKSAARFEEDKTKFLAEVEARAEKLRVAGDEKDKLIAKGAQTFQDELAKARAAQATARVRFEQELVNMPKELVVSPGVLQTVMRNGGQVSELFPEVVRIKHKTWVLPPGKIVEVPRVVAEVVRQRRANDAEQSERKEALSAQTIDTKLAKRWGEIDRKYGNQSEAIPVGTTE